jgi:uncharacterized protein (UPF0335 family)
MNCALDPQPFLVYFENYISRGKSVEESIDLFNKKVKTYVETRGEIFEDEGKDNFFFMVASNLPVIESKYISSRKDAKFTNTNLIADLIIENFNKLSTEYDSRLEIKPEDPKEEVVNLLPEPEIASSTNPDLTPELMGEFISKLSDEEIELLDTAGNYFLEDFYGRYFVGQTANLTESFNAFFKQNVYRQILDLRVNKSKNNGFMTTNMELAAEKAYADFMSKLTDTRLKALSEYEGDLSLADLEIKETYYAYIATANKENFYNLMASFYNVKIKREIKEVKPTLQQLADLARFGGESDFGKETTRSTSLSGDVDHLEQGSKLFKFHLSNVPLMNGNNGVFTTDLVNSFRNDNAYIDLIKKLRVGKNTKAEFTRQLKNLADSGDKIAISFYNHFVGPKYKLDGQERFSISGAIKYLESTGDRSPMVREEIAKLNSLLDSFITNVLSAEPKPIIKTNNNRVLNSVRELSLDQNVFFQSFEAGFTSINNSELNNRFEKVSISRSFENENEYSITINKKNTVKFIHTGNTGAPIKVVSVNLFESKIPDSNIVSILRDVLGVRFDIDQLRRYNENYRLVSPQYSSDDTLSPENLIGNLFYLVAANKIGNEFKENGLDLPLPAFVNTESSGLKYPILDNIYAFKTALHKSAEQPIKEKTKDKDIKGDVIAKIGAKRGVTKTPEKINLAKQLDNTIFRNDIFVGDKGKKVKYSINNIIFNKGGFVYFGEKRAVSSMNNNERLHDNIVNLYLNSSADNDFNIINIQAGTTEARSTIPVFQVKSETGKKFLSVNPKDPSTKKAAMKEYIDNESNFHKNLESSIVERWRNQVEQWLTDKKIILSDEASLLLNFTNLNELNQFIFAANISQDLAKSSTILVNELDYTKPLQSGGPTRIKAVVLEMVNIFNDNERAERFIMNQYYKFLNDTKSLNFNKNAIDKIKLRHRDLNEKQARQSILDSYFFEVGLLSNSLIRFNGGSTYQFSGDINPDLKPSDISIEALRNLLKEKGYKEDSGEIEKRINTFIENYKLTFVLGDLYVNQSKRAAIYTSGKNHPVLLDSNEAGDRLDQIAYQALLEDPKIKLQLLGSLGEEVEQESFDAVVILSPIYLAALNNSFGGKLSNFISEGAPIKNASDELDLVTGVYRPQKKASFNLFTGEFMKNASTEFHTIFRKAHDTIKFIYKGKETSSYDLFLENGGYDDFDRAILKAGKIMSKLKDSQGNYYARNKYISAIVMPSAEKSGSRGFNKKEDVYYSEKPLIFTEYDQNYTGIILNASHDTDVTESKKSLMSQAVFAIAFEGNSFNEVDNINSTLSSLADSNMNKFINDAKYKALEIAENLEKSDKLSKEYKENLSSEKAIIEASLNNYSDYSINEQAFNSELMLEGVRSIIIDMATKSAISNNSDKIVLDLLKEDVSGLNTMQVVSHLYTTFMAGIDKSTTRVKFSGLELVVSPSYEYVKLYTVRDENGKVIGRFPKNVAEEYAINNRKGEGILAVFKDAKLPDEIINADKKNKGELFAKYLRNKHPLDYIKINDSEPVKVWKFLRDNPDLNTIINNVNFKYQEVDLGLETEELQWYKYIDQNGLEIREYPEFKEIFELKNRLNALEKALDKDGADKAVIVEELKAIKTRINLNKEFIKNVLADPSRKWEVEDAEFMMPAHMSKQYNLPSEISIYDIIGLETSGNKLYFKNGVKVDSKTPGATLVYTSQYISMNNKFRELIRTNLNKYFTKEELKEMPLEDKDLFIKDLAEKQARNFMSTLEVFGARVPTTGKQSLFAGKIKEFINSTENSLYGPVEMLSITGADHDKDTKHLLFKSTDKFGVIYDYTPYLVNGKLNQNTVWNIIKSKSEGLSLEEKQKITSEEFNKFNEASKNFILDNFRTAIKDPKNAIEASVLVGIDKILGALEGRGLSTNVSELTDDFVVHGDKDNTSVFSAASHLSQENSALLGSSSIGIGATGMKGYAALFTAFMKIIKSGTTEEKEQLKFFREMPQILNGAKDQNVNDLFEKLYGKINLEERSISLFYKDKESGKYKRDKRDTLSNIDPFDPRYNSTYNKYKEEYNQLINSGSSLEEIDNYFVNELDLIKSKYGISDISEIRNIDNKNQAWSDISQLVNAATDNAKYMALGKLNITMDTFGIIDAAVSLGFDLSKILDMVNNPLFVEILNEVTDSRSPLNTETPTSLSTVLKTRLKSLQRAIFDPSKGDISIKLKEISDLKLAFEEEVSFDEFNELFTSNDVNLKFVNVKNYRSSNSAEELVKFREEVKSILKKENFDERYLYAYIEMSNTPFKNVFISRVNSTSDYKKLAASLGKELTFIGDTIVKNDKQIKTPVLFNSNSLLISEVPIESFGKTTKNNINKIYENSYSYKEDYQAFINRYNENRKLDKILHDKQLSNLEEDFNRDWLASPIRQIFILQKAAKEKRIITSMLNINQGQKVSQSDYLAYLDSFIKSVNSINPDEFLINKSDLHEFIKSVKGDGVYAKELIKKYEKIKTAFNPFLILSKNEHYFSWIEVAVKANNIISRIAPIYTVSEKISDLLPNKNEDSEFEAYNFAHALAVEKFFKSNDKFREFSFNGKKFDLASPGGKKAFSNELINLAESLILNPNYSKNPFIKSLVSDIKVDRITNESYKIIKSANLAYKDPDQKAAIKNGLINLKNDKNNPELYDALYLYSLILNKGAKSTHNYASLFDVSETNLFKEYIEFTNNGLLYTEIINMISTEFDYTFVALNALSSIPLRDTNKPQYRSFDLEDYSDDLGGDELEYDSFNKSNYILPKKLKEKVFISRQTRNVYYWSDEFSRYIKLTPIDPNKSLNLDIDSADKLKASGWKLGTTVKINGDGFEADLLYFKEGSYVIRDKSGAIFNLEQEDLKLFNPDMVFNKDQVFKTSVERAKEFDEQETDYSLSKLGLESEDYRDILKGDKKYHILEGIPENLEVGAEIKVGQDLRNAGIKAIYIGPKSTGFNNIPNILNSMGKSRVKSINPYVESPIQVGVVEFISTKVPESIDFKKFEYKKGIIKSPKVAAGLANHIIRKERMFTDGKDVNRIVRISSNGSNDNSRLYIIKEVGQVKDMGKKGNQWSDLLGYSKGVDSKPNYFVYYLEPYNNFDNLAFSKAEYDIMDLPKNVDMSKFNYQIYNLSSNTEFDDNLSKLRKQVGASFIPANIPSLRFDLNQPGDKDFQLMFISFINNPRVQDFKTHLSKLNSILPPGSEGYESKLKQILNSSEEELAKIGITKSIDFENTVRRVLSDLKNDYKLGFGEYQTEIMKLALQNNVPVKLFDTNLEQWFEISNEGRKPILNPEASENTRFLIDESLMDNVPELAFKGVDSAVKKMAKFIELKNNPVGELRLIRDLGIDNLQINESLNQPVEESDVLSEIYSLKDFSMIKEVELKTIKSSSGIVKKPVLNGEILSENDFVSFEDVNIKTFEDGTMLITSSTEYNTYYWMAAKNESIINNYTPFLSNNFRESFKIKIGDKFYVFDKLYRVSPLAFQYRDKMLKEKKELLLMADKVQDFYKNEIGPLFSTLRYSNLEEYHSFRKYHGFNQFMTFAKQGYIKFNTNEQIKNFNKLLEKEIEYNKLREEYEDKFYEIRSKVKSKESSNDNRTLQELVDNIDNTKNNHVIINIIGSDLITQGLKRLNIKNNNPGFVFSDNRGSLKNVFNYTMFNADGALDADFSTKIGNIINKAIAEPTKTFYINIPYNFNDEIAPGVKASNLFYEMAKSVRNFKSNIKVIDNKGSLLEMLSSGLNPNNINRNKKFSLTDDLLAFNVTYLHTYLSFDGKSLKDHYIEAIGYGQREKEAKRFSLSTRSKDGTIMDQQKVLTNIWRTWAQENPGELEKIAAKIGKSGQMYDSNGNSSVNNYKALKTILDEKFVDNSWVNYRIVKLNKVLGPDQKSLVLTELEKKDLFQNDNELLLDIEGSIYKASFNGVRREPITNRITNDISIGLGIPEDVDDEFEFINENFPEITTNPFYLIDLQPWKKELKVTEPFKPGEVADLLTARGVDLLPGHLELAKKATVVYSIDTKMSILDDLNKTLSYTDRIAEYKKAYDRGIVLDVKSTDKVWFHGSTLEDKNSTSSIKDAFDNTRMFLDKALSARAEILVGTNSGIEEMIRSYIELKTTIFEDGKYIKTKTGYKFVTGPIEDKKSKLTFYKPFIGPVNRFNDNFIINSEPSVLKGGPWGIKFYRNIEQSEFIASGKTLKNDAYKLDLKENEIANWESEVNGSFIEDYISQIGLEKVANSKLDQVRGVLLFEEQQFIKNLIKLKAVLNGKPALFNELDSLITVEELLNKIDSEINEDANMQSEYETMYSLMFKEGDILNISDVGKMAMVRSHQNTIEYILDFFGESFFEHYYDYNELSTQAFDIKASRMFNLFSYKRSSLEKDRNFRSIVDENSISSQEMQLIKAENVKLSDFYRYSKTLGDSKIFSKNYFISGRLLNQFLISKNIKAISYKETVSILSNDISQPISSKNRYIDESNLKIEDYNVFQSNADLIKVQLQNFKGGKYYAYLYDKCSLRIYPNKIRFTIGNEVINFDYDANTVGAENLNSLEEVIKNKVFDLYFSRLNGISFSDGTKSYLLDQENKKGVMQLINGHVKYRKSNYKDLMSLFKKSDKIKNKISDSNINNKQVFEFYNYTNKEGITKVVYLGEDGSDIDNLDKFLITEDGDLLRHNGAEWVNQIDESNKIVNVIPTDEQQSQELILANPRSIGETFDLIYLRNDEKVEGSFTIEKEDSDDILGSRTIARNENGDVYIWNPLINAWELNSTLGPVDDDVLQSYDKVVPGSKVFTLTLKGLGNVHLIEGYAVSKNEVVDLRGTYNREENGAWVKTKDGESRLFENTRIKFQKEPTKFVDREGKSLSSKKVGKRAMRKIFNGMMANSGVDAEILTDKQIREKYGINYAGKPGFKFDNNLVINSDYATLDTPLHELGHFFIENLKITNPKLYNLIINEALKSDIRSKIESKYEENNEEDIAQEIFSTMLGLVNQDKLPQVYLNTWDKIINIIETSTSIGNFFKNMINFIFGSNIEEVDLKDNFSNILSNIGEDILTNPSSVLFDLSNGDATEIQKIINPEVSAQDIYKKLEALNFIKTVCN